MRALRNRYVWVQSSLPGLSLGFHIHIGYHWHLDLHLPFVILSLGRHGQDEV